MKKIGLVGGISWTSTVYYYRYINEEVNRRTGGLNYAECIIYSLNFNKFSSSMRRIIGMPVTGAQDWIRTRLANQLFIAELCQICVALKKN
jgi:hypothetical protein